ncbi:MAG TPA: ribonuclease HII [Methylomirabilota bacterium]|nr:ribonuclease HII [Methylomirabilota bacterium]
MTAPFDPAMAHRYPPLIGCDEAGRGALCGPVVVAAVWFDPTAIPPDLLGALDDSKKLAAKVRERLAGEIMRVARVAVAASSASRIDGHGIRTVTLDAMRRAVLRLGIGCPVRIDGLDIPPGIDLPCEAVVRGDGLVPQIAAGSIIAKTCRDRIMTRLSARHDGYRWERNAGYGTADHLAALSLLGPSRHHRRTFRPVSQAWLPLGGIEPAEGITSVADVILADTA